MSAVPERIDAVTYQVIQSRLSGIVQEMQESIFRTGYSTIIRESQDASCMILDAGGDVVGEHVVLPLHATCLPAVVRNVKAAYDDIAAGDIFITNHPYLGGVPHSMDMAVVAPVFSGAYLVGFCASIAHKSDLGGPIPGTANGSARDIFHEGIQYPPIRLMRDGRTIGEVEAILNANSRTPQLVLGDIRGQIGVARLGERRILETIERYGLGTLLAAFARKQDATERQIRQTLRTWEDGVHQAESYLEMGDASRPPVRFHVRIEKTGDRIAFDLTGCDDQVDEPINIHPPLVRGCIAYAMIATIDPELANNGGVARVIETRFRPGSIVNPNFPAPTELLHSVDARGYRSMPRGADRLRAGTAHRTSRRIRCDVARRYAHRRLAFRSIRIGGIGVRRTRGSDGPSGIAVLLSNARSASIEILESEFPTRIRRFELIADSGGAGEFRGGLAARREVEVLAPEAQLSLRGHGHRIAAAGRDGGANGRPASCTLHPGTPEAQSFPARFSGVRVRTRRPRSLRTRRWWWTRQSAVASARERYRRRAQRLRLARERRTRLRYRCRSARGSPLVANAGDPVSRLRIAVDTGGTFTDFVVLDETTGAVDVFKVTSTRGHEADGIVDGMRELSRAFRRAGRDDIVFFSHGTTVGTNAILEGTGARVGLFVTEGFRGIYEVGEQSRPYGSTTYDLFFEKPRALVTPYFTAEVAERVLFDGSVLVEFDEASARARSER